MTGKRLSKFQRQEGAVPHVLTDRDRAIITAVADHRLLSRSQIQRLLGFGTITRVNFRLQKLFHHGYLRRDYLPLVHGSSQAIYRVDRLGVPVAAERLGKTSAELWQSRKRLKLLFLDHELAINDVWIAFELAARAHPNHRLVEWRSEASVRDRFFDGAAWHTLTPDAFGRYKAGDRVLSFFVEVDRATMSANRFQEKVARYVAYEASGRYEEKYEWRHFRVLVVTQSAARIASLTRATTSMTRRLFWFAALNDLRQPGPLGAIWNPVNAETKCSLLSVDRSSSKGTLGTVASNRREDVVEGVGEGLAEQGVASYRAERHEESRHTEG